jgi:hypothetical protein
MLVRSFSTHFKAALRLSSPTTVAQHEFTLMACQACNEPVGRTINFSLITISAQDIADQTAGLRPRWSLGAYCRPQQENMLDSRDAAGWTGPTMAMSRRTPPMITSRQPPPCS